MGAMVRLFGLLLLVQTVVYLWLLFRARRSERDRLLDVFDSEGHTGSREVFVQKGLETFENSVQRKLLIGVYILPICAIGAIIIVTNTI